MPPCAESSALLPFFLVPAGCGSSSDGGGGGSGNTPEAEAGPDVAAALDVTVPPPEAAMKAEASRQDSTPVDAGPTCTTTPCVTELGVGAAHTCVRLSDGTARCWGSNLSGELGVGTLSDAGFDGGNGAIPPRLR